MRVIPRSVLAGLAIFAIGCAGAVDASYPALYLWNQPSTDDNHTPSWDDYQIPPVIIP